MYDNVLLNTLLHNTNRQTDPSEPGTDTQKTENINRKDEEKSLALLKIDFEKVFIES